MSERDEWQALVDADSLHLLPDEALIASIKQLAQRCLDLTDEPQNSESRQIGSALCSPTYDKQPFDDEEIGYEGTR